MATDTSSRAWALSLTDRMSAPHMKGAGVGRPPRRVPGAAQHLLWCAAEPGPLRMQESGTVPDQRGITPLRFVLHRVREKAPPAWASKKQEGPPPPNPPPPSPPPRAAPTRIPPHH